VNIEEIAWHGRRRAIEALERLSITQVNGGTRLRHRGGRPHPDPEPATNGARWIARGQQKPITIRG
jgi:hypothetical protein